MFTCLEWFMNRKVGVLKSLKWLINCVFKYDTGAQLLQATPKGKKVRKQETKKEIIPSYTYSFTCPLSLVFILSRCLTPSWRNPLSWNLNAWDAQYYWNYIFKHLATKLSLPQRGWSMQYFFDHVKKVPQSLKDKKSPNSWIWQEDTNFR